jgi:hypothetical protein
MSNVHPIRPKATEPDLRITLPTHVQEWADKYAPPVEDDDGE